VRAADVSSDSRRAAGAWLAVLAAAFVALAATSYRARDPDSRLYAEISARLSRAPLADWIAPEFPPGWFMAGPFREHPVGIFVPAASLAALGYPAEQAAYAMNAGYQVLGIVLLQRLAATYAAPLESRALGWLIQLLPIAFTFRIRANHEAAVLLCLLAALYGTERARRDKRFAMLVASGFVGLLLVKGLLAAFAPLVCALWLLARRRAGSGSPPSDRTAWLALAAGVVAMGIAAAAYEGLHRQVTGEPFWSLYAARQLGVAAASEVESGTAAKLYNLVFYLGRLVWFPFPWSLVALAALWRWRATTSEASSVATSAPPSSVSQAETGGGLWFVAAVVVAYLGAFSLSDRRADRYIFPAYYAIGTAGVIAALRLSTHLRRVAERLDRPWVPAMAWTVLFAAHLFAGRLGLPTVKLWTP
jgi:hypothetical protein